jgi:putative PEP-CTERM system TPR-repeat lipoprotein
VFLVNRGGIRFAGGRWLGAALLAFLLAACGEKTEQAMVAEIKAALEQGDSAKAMILAKNTLQEYPDSGSARLLFGQLTLDSGDIGSAEIELRKAQNQNQPADEVAPLLARTLISQRQYAKVIDEFSATRLSDPAKQSELDAIVAAAHAHAGRTDKASAIIEANLARTPGHVPSRLLQARFEAARGDVDKALALVNQTAETAPKDLDTLLLKGDFLMLKGDKAAAAATYKAALGVQPASVHAHTQLVAIHIVERDLKSARQQMEQFTRIRPNHPQTQFLQAQMALAEGDYARARDLSAQLMRFTKDNPRLLYVAGAAELGLNALVRAENFLATSLKVMPESAATRRLLATVHLRSGQFQKALAVLEPLVESRTPDAEALSIAAMTHLANNDPKTAQTFFARVVKLNPSDVKARTALALAQIGKGDAESAMAELQAIAASDGGNLADLALINARLSRGEQDRALQAIDALDRKQPNKPYAADLRGRVFLAQNDAAKARAAFEQAVSRDPVFYPSISALASMDLAQGRPEDAQKRYEALLKVAPGNVQALIAMAEVRAKQGAPAADVEQWLARAISAKPSEPTSHVLLVDHWLRLQQPKQAITVAQAGLAANPDDPTMLDALGRAQYVGGDVTQSIVSFSKVAALQPTSAQAQLRLADAFNRAKNYPAAEQALRKALQLAPDAIAPKRGLILLAVQAKNREKALEVAAQTRKQQPNDALGHLLEADVHAAFRDLDAAARALRGGLEKKGGGAAAVRLHTVLVVAKRQQEADKFAEDWLKQHPKEVRMRSHLAQAALNAGDNARAEQLFAQVVGTAPNDALALNNLSWLRATQGKADAIDLAKRAVSLAPRSGKFLDTLAFALAQQNQLDAALKAQKDAVRVEPNEPILRLNLAKLQLRANDKAGAKVELETLSKLGDKFARQQEVAELRKGL